SRHHRLRRAAAGDSADPAAHPRPDQRSEAAEREDSDGRAVLRSEDAQRDRARDRRAGAGHAAIGRRGEGSDRLLQAVRLRHQSADRGDQEIRSEVMLDSGMLAFLLPPFVASLILTGIHAYLGVHVVERGVIFVDLSLAQIAALGATIALLLPVTGGDPHAPIVYWISLAFTFLGAAVFATIRVRRARIPQEAIIGICYAVASAASILAMSKATSESEHLKDMLVGNILAVSWGEVAKTAALYGAIGLFHYVFRRQFLAISMSHHHDTHHHEIERPRLNVRLWDFLFYASFGFVVTSSVSIAGVLLVF